MKRAFILVIAFMLFYSVKAQISMQVIDSLTVDSLGACQGISIQSGHVYLYGDREVGVIRKYTHNNGKLHYTGEEIKLTIDGKDVINHPTGFAHNKSSNVFIGNSSRLNTEGTLWKANIFYINWEKLKRTKDLKKSLIREIDDDACIQGTRPEFIKYKGKDLIATADYGNKQNEVRLYDYKKMTETSKTSAPGVLVHKFICSPWVQNLKWVPEKGVLILIQNQVEGRYWRFTFLDLEKSILAGKEHVIQTVDINKSSELEGFDLLDMNTGIATTSSKKNNVFHIKITW